MNELKYQIANFNIKKFLSSASDLLITIGLLFLPQAVLAIFSSLNLRSKSSLEKIITRHPSILLLPVFTFFTFSKLNESRVSFSKKFSWINIGVSAVGYVAWSVWGYYYLESYSVYLKLFPFTFLTLLIMTFTPFLLSSFLTVLFLHLDRLCSCCSCCLEPGEEISVYDPHTDQRLLLRDGQMVEPPEEDLEAGNSSPPSIAEVSKTDDIDMTVIQDINENQEQEDEDNEEDDHDTAVVTKEEIILDNEGVDTTEEKLAHNDVEVSHEHENV